MLVLPLILLGAPRQARRIRLDRQRHLLGHVAQRAKQLAVDLPAVAAPGLDQRLDHVARQARAADPGYSAVAPVPGYSQERWARHAHPGVGQPTAAVEPYEPDDDYRTDWGTAFRQRAIRGAACVISPDETRDPAARQL